MVDTYLYTIKNPKVNCTACQIAFSAMSTAKDGIWLDLSYEFLE
jgi:hypothetical protein